MKSFSLVLASGSRYRSELLARLRLPFEAATPEVDEQPRPGEAPAQLALRLAREKAMRVAEQYPEAWVIGSDQVADLDGQPVGKPGTRERARSQLLALRGRVVRFHTAVCLHSLSRRRENSQLVDTTVTYRAFSEAEVDRYLELEPAFDCAGSAKCEGLGISLLDRLESEDPTAIVGLPLITLSAMLRAEQIGVP